MTLRYALLPLCLLAALPTIATAAPTRGLQVEDLVSITRVSAPLLTADGRHVLFLQRSADADYKGSSAVFIRNLLTRDLREPEQLTPEGWNVSAPSLSADGATLYFLSAQSGSNQLYAMPVAGGTPRQLTAFARGIDTYKVAPAGDRVLFSADVYQDCGSDLACTTARLDAKKADKASGVLFDGVFVRHWDSWADGRRNTLFVAPLPSGDAAPVAGASAISATLAGDAPSKPFGGSEDYSWSPDGKSIVAAVRVAGAGEPWSTNFDLYRLDPAGRSAPVNLTAANPAWDAGPVFSADGKTLYYRAMTRPGFEADRFGLMAMDLRSGKTRQIAPDWDRSADGIVLSDDGKTLYTAAQDTGEHPLFAVDIASGQVNKLVGQGSIGSFDVAGDTLAFTRNTLHSNDQVLVTNASAAAPLRAITPSAAQQLPEVGFGAFEQFSFAGWNNQTVHGYVVKPWNFEEGKQYPVAFLIHGGPQGSFGNAWSQRWNPQTYAAQGYAVVMIDFHGSTGYGQAFTDAISQHWGDRPLEDLRKGWAAAQQKYAFLDGDNACALGASYGGYMINWIAGNWTDGFKCLVNHNGVFDTRSMGAVTEELWFTEWEFGGPLYSKPEGYEAFNPARHIDKWQTPMLVVAGQNDFRVPLDQSLSTFHTLQRKGIDSQLLYFPDENHWVLKPHNSIQWHNTVNAWLAKHLGQ